jgi:hypothetical protein
MREVKKEMDEQRIREIVREEMKKAAEEKAADVVIKFDADELARVVSQTIKRSLSSDGKPQE